MFNLIIVVAIVLILAIAFTIFRVTQLVGIAKGDSKKYVVSSANKLQATLLVLFLIVGVGAFFYYSFGGLDDSYTQPIASEHGEKTDFWFWVTMGVTCFVFILTQILLFGFSYLYQYKEGNKATFYPHNNKLEVIWTAIPAVVLAILVISGWKVWVDITGPAPDDAEVIEVYGYQYAFAFRYPGKDKKLGAYDYRKTDLVNNNQVGIDYTDKAAFDDFMGRELHVPKGKPVLLKIRARDVIHSVFQPNFRLQMNAVPGLPTKFWFVPTKTTEEMRQETGNPDFNYELVCNKICGKAHFSMKGIIVVDEPEDYEKWYNEQEALLKQNPALMSQVPDDLKEMAIISSDLENIENTQAVEASIGSSY